MQDRNKRRKLRNSWASLNRYLANSSIHGVKYIVEDDRHWTERIFWLIGCALSWYFCSLMISGVFSQFLERKVDITMETNYLEWEAEFPSIHFCTVFSKSALLYARKITGVTRIAEKISSWQNVGFVTGASKQPSSEELINMTELIKPTCEDVFGICTWNDVPIDCCQIFLPLKTNSGHCLSFNSVHTTPPLRVHHPSRFTVNHKMKLAKLSLLINNTEYFDYATTGFFKKLKLQISRFPIVENLRILLAYCFGNSTMLSSLIFENEFEVDERTGYQRIRDTFYIARKNEYRPYPISSFNSLKPDVVILSHCLIHGYRQQLATTESYSLGGCDLFERNYDDDRTVFMYEVFRHENSKQKVYMMDRIEIPLQSSGADKVLPVNWGRIVSTVDINAIPTLNDPSILAMPPAVRGCRTIDESEDNLRIYSYGGCQLNTQIKNSLYMCGCVSHLFPFDDGTKVCNLTELACVNKNRKWILNTTESQCLPDCDETAIEYSHNFDNNTSLPDWSAGQIDFSMMPGPTLCYQRFPSHSALDIVVAVGSAVGLFAGASILSLVEIPYWLLMRN